MNAKDLNQKIDALLNEAFQQGVAQQNLTVFEIVGLLEMHKADLIRWAQDEAIRQRSAAIQKAFTIPPNLNGSKR